jgi:hypothetical protein
MALKVALTGKLLVGDAVFTAQQDVAVDLLQGGGWKPGEYTVAGLPVVAEITTFKIDVAALNEDYSVTIRGQTFTVDSGGAPTVTTIRDALKALIDASSLDVTTADVAADSCSVLSNVAGEGLKLSVLAETAINMSIDVRDSVPSALGVISRDSGQFTLRNPAAITARFGVMVAA